MSQFQPRISVEDAFKPSTVVFLVAENAKLQKIIYDLRDQLAAATSQKESSELLLQQSREQVSQLQNIMQSLEEKIEIREQERDRELLQRKAILQQHYEDATQQLARVRRECEAAVHGLEANCREYVANATNAVNQAMISLREQERRQQPESFLQVPHNSCSFTTHRNNETFSRLVVLPSPSPAASGIAADSSFKRQQGTPSIQAVPPTPHSNLSSRSVGVRPMSTLNRSHDASLPGNAEQSIRHVSRGEIHPAHDDDDDGADDLEAAAALQAMLNSTREFMRISGENTEDLSELFRRLTPKPPQKIMPEPPFPPTSGGKLQPFSPPFPNAT